MNDFQESFLRWLDAIRGSLLVKLVFDHFARDKLVFSFAGYSRNILLLVASSEIRVLGFDSDPERLDRAFSTDFAPSLFRIEVCSFEPRPFEDYTIPGKVCVAWQHDQTVRNPEVTTEQIVSEHCFAKLLTWINDELASAYWLLLTDTGDDIWASLQTQNESIPSSDDEEGDQHKRVQIVRRRGRR